MDIPLHRSCSLIGLHECGLIAIDKAAGVVSHPNREKSSQNALLTVAYDHDEEAYCEGGTRWYLLNRLDAPTSGVILLAGNREIAQAVKLQFASHAVSKSYLAVVKGVPPRSRDTWRDCLQSTRRAGQLRTRTLRGKPNAQTHMLLRERGSGPPARSLLQLNPLTGRTHQLRVQCAGRRLPIIGDATYGDFEFNKVMRNRTGSSRLMLHSWKTRIETGLAGESVFFEATSPPPEIFAIALG